MAYKLDKIKFYKILILSWYLRIKKIDWKWLSEITFDEKGIWPNKEEIFNRLLKLENEQLAIMFSYNLIYILDIDYKYFSQIFYSQWLVEKFLVPNYLDILKDFEKNLGRCLSERIFSKY